MSICKRGNSLPRAGNLEIHVAVMIFGAGDVGEDGVLIALDHQSHRDSGAAEPCSGTPASIIASEPPQTVAIEDEPFDSRMSETTRMAYGKSASGRQQIAERALRQRSVPDFASSCVRAGISLRPPRTAGNCSAA